MSHIRVVLGFHIIFSIVSLVGLLLENSFFLLYGVLANVVCSGFSTYILYKLDKNETD